MSKNKPDDPAFRLAQSLGNLTVPRLASEFEQLRAITRLTEALAPAAAAFQDIQRALSPAFEQLRQHLRELPERARSSTRVLAHHGWYMHGDMTPGELGYAADLFGDEAEVEAAHEHMCAQYEGVAESLLDSLTQQFPHRSRLFASAFAAHERDDFAASVPLFLAQADGICHEITSVQLYGKHNGVPRIATVLGQLDDGFLIASVVAPLMETTPLNANEKERAVMPDDILNRHAVLHGESTTYDTRLNSFRAMSLLGYVAWVVEHMPADSPKPER